MFCQLLLLLFHSQVTGVRTDQTQSIKRFEFIKFVRLANHPASDGQQSGQQNNNAAANAALGNVHHTLPAHFLHSNENTAFVRAVGQQLQVDLFSLSRLFSMVLIPSVNFPVIATRSNQSKHFNATCYSGFLRDSPSVSRLFAYFHNDLLNAVISVHDDDVYHLDELDNQTVIMYRERGIDLGDYEHLKRQPTSNLSFKHHSASFGEFFEFGSQQPMPDQSKNQSKNKQNNLIEFPPFPRRTLLFSSGAQASGAPNPIRPSICEIELVSDHTFSEFFRHDTVRISSELFLMLMKANMIYSQMDFNLDGRPDGITLQVSRIVIYHTPNEKGYTWSSTELKPVELLEKFGLRIQNHCLAITFLHRDFSAFKEFDGLLGLAWVGAPQKSFGICSKPVLNPQVSPKELWQGNTGFITNKMRGKARTRAEASTTLSHEIGHAFGAQHDDSDAVIKQFGQCSTKYIMAAIDSGEQTPTKEQFSYCSKQQINPVLQANSGCFKPYQPRCGNAIKEYGEECDCGPEFICSQIDPCCQAGTCRLKPECRHRRPPAVQPTRMPTGYRPTVGPVPPPNVQRPVYYPPPNRPSYLPNRPVYPPNRWPPSNQVPPNRWPPPNQKPPNQVPPNYNRPTYYRPPSNYPPLYRPAVPPPNYNARPNQPPYVGDPNNRRPPPFRQPTQVRPPTDQSENDRFKYILNKKVDEKDDIFKFMPRDENEDSFPVYDDVSYGSFE